MTNISAERPEKPGNSKKPGRPKKEKRFVKRDIYLPPELDGFVQQVASQEGVSFSGAVCLAVQKWKEVYKHGIQKEGTQEN